MHLIWQVARGRRLVALIHFLLLVIVTAVCAAVWWASHEPFYWLAAAFALWCVVVQLRLRRTVTDWERWKSQQWRVQTGIGLACLAFMLAQVGWPLLTWMSQR